MSKTVWKFCFDFLEGQEKWLNRMAQRGWRLTGCGRARYTFEPAAPGAYEYAVVYLAGQPSDMVRDYGHYLELRGLRAFAKSMTLNFSFGKTRWQPYENQAQSTLPQAGEYGKELLILERESGGEAFSHTTSAALSAHAYRSAGRTYLQTLVMVLALVLATFLPTARTLSAPIVWTLRAILMAFALFYAALCVYYTLLASRSTEG